MVCSSRAAFTSLVGSAAIAGIFDKPCSPKSVVEHAQMFEDSVLTPPLSMRNP